MPKKSPQPRLFFAIELSPQIKTQLLNCQQQLSRLDAAPVKAENLHLTLCFLGNTPTAQLHSILDNFQPIPLAPFEITLEQLIYWPKAKVLAVHTLSQPESRLVEGKQLIERQLSDNHIFNRDKKTFKPHITLFRQLEQPPETCLNYYLEAEKIQQKKLTMLVESVALMQTISTPNSYYYETLAEWPLIKQTSVKQQLLGR